MGSITGNRAIIRKHDDAEVCVCSHTTEKCNNYSNFTNPNKIPFLSKGTIYRVNSNKDVFGKQTDSGFNAYRDVILGSEYVVPALHYINTPDISNILGIGNPTNKTVSVRINYPTGKNFSFSLCDNGTQHLELKGYEVKDFRLDCHIAGTHINASNKIIVYSAGELNGTFMVEQLLPVNLWESYYVVFPSGKHSTEDIVTVLTAYDNTTVHIFGYDYVTIPHKYDSIQRNITSDSALTITSSEPVSVTQFINDGTGWAMITIIPMTYELNTQNLIDMNDDNLHAFATTNGRDIQNKTDEIPMFSKYYTNSSEIKVSGTAHTVYGCRVLKHHSVSREIMGSNCALGNFSRVRSLLQ